MNMSRLRLDDTLNFALVAAAAVLAVGLEVSTSMGYVLDRGSVQARHQARANQLRFTGVSASDASKDREQRLASRGR